MGKSKERKIFEHHFRCPKCKEKVFVVATEKTIKPAIKAEIERNITVAKDAQQRLDDVE